MKKEEILELLYNAVKEELQPSVKVRQAEKKFVEIREKFLKEVGEQYSEKLEKVTDAVINMCIEEEKQFFYEGYKTAETVLIDKYKRGV